MKFKRNKTSRILVKKMLSIIPIVAMLSILMSTSVFAGVIPSTDIKIGESYTVTITGATLWNDTADPTGEGWYLKNFHFSSADSQYIEVVSQEQDGENIKVVVKGKKVHSDPITLKRYGYLKGSGIWQEEDADRRLTVSLNPPECTCSEHDNHIYVYNVEESTANVIYYSNGTPCDDVELEKSIFTSAGLSCQVNTWYYVIGESIGLCTSQSPSTPSGGTDQGSSSSGSGSSSTKTESIPVDVIAEREALENTMPISPVTIDTTQFKQADAAIVPGTAYNLSNFTTTSGIVRGINAAVEGANKTGANEATIYSGNPLCFNNAIIKAINDGKKDIVYYFTYNGHVYSVTVPATVDAKKVLDKAPFAGPFYVGQQLGTTRLIK